MKHLLIYPASSADASACALRILQKNGIAAIDHPAPEITHLLLDVPSFGADCFLRSGGDIRMILERIPQNVTVIGGNLNHPALEGYRKLDLLHDEGYLARNAAITADCALKTAAPLLKSCFRDTPTLVIGWGRIGTYLARMLRTLDTPVSVAARNPKDRAILAGLGYPAVDTGAIPPDFRLVFNTAPAEISLPEMPDCIKIDLASFPGLSGADVIRARGLPGRLAPESAGALIAETILRLCKEESS